MRKISIRVVSTLCGLVIGFGVARLSSYGLRQPAGEEPEANYGPDDECQIAGVATSTPEFNESGAAQPTDTALDLMQPHAVSISPYEIKRLIEKDKLSPCRDGGYSRVVDFEAIREKLNLKMSDVLPERCSPRVKAAVQAIELDGKPGKETLLQLDFGEPYATLYLIFGHIDQHGVAVWNLLGAIPYEYGAPFVPPSHKVRSDGLHSWLIIDHSTGHGSSFGTGSDDWYEINQNGVRQVLTYQNGYFFGYGNPTMDRDTKVLECEYRDGISIITLQSTTNYGSYDHQTDDSFTLWTSKRKAIFIRGPGMPRFVLDALHSEMPAAEIDPSTDIDADTSILKYNYRELVKVLVKGNAKQRNWLRDFLNKCEHCNDSEEKQTLQKALARPQP